MSATSPVTTLRVKYPGHLGPEATTRLPANRSYTWKTDQERDVPVAVGRQLIRFSGFVEVGPERAAGEANTVPTEQKTDDPDSAAGETAITTEPHPTTPTRGRRRAG